MMKVFRDCCYLFLQGWILKFRELGGENIVRAVLDSAFSLGNRLNIFGYFLGK